MHSAARTCLLVLFFLLVAHARASDRPYLAATHAVSEEDDDNMAEIESWIEWSRRVREFRFEPEYNFDPRNAVRVEFGVKNDRRFDPSLRTHGVEVEYKHLFTDLARSGFGSGFIAAVEWENRAPDEDDGAWSIGTAALATLRPTPDTLLHFNLGVAKEAGEGVRGRWAVAAEHEIVRRTTLFVEAGVRAGEERLIHGGIRHWVKRERFAIDLTVGRRRSDPASSTFITLGIALQDIGW